MFQDLVSQHVAVAEHGNLGFSFNCSTNAPVGYNVLPIDGDFEGAQITLNSFSGSDYLVCSYEIMLTCSPLVNVRPFIRTYGGNAPSGVISSDANCYPILARADYISVDLILYTAVGRCLIPALSSDDYPYQYVAVGLPTGSAIVDLNGSISLRSYDGDFDFFQPLK